MLVVAAATISLAAEAQGVKVALLPASQVVAPGSDFEVTLEVTRAGSPFNAFDAYVGFDPAALTPVPLAPISLQEGAYFTGSCGSRFHRFHAGSDRDTVSDALLCAGVSRTGPGTIYRLRFHASSTPQVTAIRFLPGLQFYNAGLFVNPDSSSDAVVGIGMTAAAPELAGLGVLRLAATPNPVRGSASFRIDADRAGTHRLSIVDVQGRTVRTLDSSAHPSGARTVAWDGRDDSGRRVPAGQYVAVLRLENRTVETRFAVLR